MWPLLLYRKHYRDRLQIDRRGVRAAQAWGNAWAEADMLKRLGRACTTSGRFEEAERHLRRSAALCRDIDDARGAADAREALALLRLDTGREDEAAELFGELAAAYRRLGQRRSLGLTLINLGMLLPRLGRARQALALLDQAREIFAEIAESDPYNTARLGVALAAAHLGCGDVAEAEEAAAQAARQMRALGSENGEAEALEALGEAARRHGDRDAARSRLQQALEIFTSLGSPRAARVRERIRELTGPPRPTQDPGATPASGDDAEL